MSMIDVPRQPDGSTFSVVVKKNSILIIPAPVIYRSFYDEMVSRLKAKLGEDFLIQCSADVEDDLPVFAEKEA